MTLNELISSGVIKDTDYIQISRPISGPVSEIRGGNWFNDNILDWLDVPIYLIKWEKGRGWHVTLMREVIA